jgi:hypothetical protein
MPRADNVIFPQMPKFHILGIFVGFVGFVVVLTRRHDIDPRMICLFVEHVQHNTPDDMNYSQSLLKRVMPP